MKKLMYIGIILGLVNVACSHTGSMDEASRHYSEGVQSFSQSETGKWQAKACPKSSKELEKRDWKDLIQMANGCVLIKNWSKVEEIGNHIARQDHLAPWGSYYLSVAAEATKNYSRALWMIDLAIKKAPKVGLLAYQKGKVLWSLEEYTQAMESFEEALQRDNSLLDAHMMLGQVFYRDQEFSKAKKHFSAVLEKDAKNYTALVGLAECELKDGNDEKALALFDRAVDRNPKDLQLRLRQAYVYESLKATKEALSHYKEIESLIRKRKLVGSVGFDLKEKIKSLESTLNKVALSEEKGRTPGSEEKVAK